MYLLADMKRGTERAVTVEVLRLDESQLNVRTVTENVSPRGARNRDYLELRSREAFCWLRLQRKGVKSLGARCLLANALESTKFAVGLQLVVRV